MLRKDKPESKKTMNDFIKANQSPMAKQVKVEQANINMFRHTPEYLESVKNYNASLKNINPTYSGFKPLHEVLVRFFLFEPIVEGNIIMPFTQFVNIPTKSGNVKQQEIETDFPFRNIAVVVSAPNNNQLKAGDVVVISRKGLMMNVLGEGANAKIVVEQSFVHPSANLFEIPTDPTNEHYGYALVQYHEIRGIVDHVESK